ncbi:MAG: DMT family transporter [Myxococcota bacterium]|nr:DMT family transporter [Myxococcota bacterium]
MSSNSTESSALVVPVMVVAVFAVSSAAILVRVANSGGAEAIAPGFWRTLIVGLMLSAWIRPLSRRDLLLSVLSGVVLGAHFWAWFESLQRTTVLHSTLLVCLGPVWLGVAELAFLKKPPARRFWLGIGIAIAGAILMSTQGHTESNGIQPTLAGNLLALTGGLLASAYFFIGRDVRQRVGIASYSAIISLSAAAFLFPAAVLSSQELTGFSRNGWLAIVGLALGPQLLGHNGFNYCLRFVRASIVSAIVFLEPFGAAVLAALFLHEIPGLHEAVGGLVVLGGVLVATWKAEDLSG